MFATMINPAMAALRMDELAIEGPPAPLAIKYSHTPRLRYAPPNAVLMSPAAHTFRALAAARDHVMMVVVLRTAGLELTARLPAALVVPTKAPVQSNMVLIEAVQSPPNGMSASTMPNSVWVPDRRTPVRNPAWYRRFAFL